MEEGIKRLLNELGVAVSKVVHKAIGESREIEETIEKIKQTGHTPVISLEMLLGVKKDDEEERSLFDSGPSRGEAKAATGPPKELELDDKEDASFLRDLHILLDDPEEDPPGGSSGPSS